VCHAQWLPGKGILAADESAAHQKRFDSIKLESDEEHPAAIPEMCSRARRRDR